MLRDVEVDVGTSDQSLLEHLHPDITLMVEALQTIVIHCNKKMHARIVEVMYTALHPHGPQVAHKDAKKQDVRDPHHDYRILEYLKVSGDGSGQGEQAEQFFFSSRTERALTFSTWARTEKGISTELRIKWDCHSSQHSAFELNERVKRGEDVLPIDASFRIVRKQQEETLRMRYEEIRVTDANTRSRHRIWKWTDKGGSEQPPRPGKDMKEILTHKGWAYFAFVLDIEEEDRLKRLEREQEMGETHEHHVDENKADVYAMERAFNDNLTVAQIKVIFCLKASKPVRPRVLEVSSANYDFHVVDEDIMGADEFTLTAASNEDLGGSMSASQTMKSSNAITSSNIGTMKSGMKSAADGSLGAGLKSTTETGGTTPTTTKGEGGDEQAEKDPIADGFVREQLEVFLPLLLPFKINEAAAAGMLIMSPSEVKTPEKRLAVTRAIMMPDVFLQVVAF